jgi:hypothetical protein
MEGVAAPPMDMSGLAVTGEAQFDTLLAGLANAISRRRFRWQECDDGFLIPHGGQLVQLAAWAERYFRDDPGTCIFKFAPSFQAAPVVHLLAPKSFISPHVRRNRVTRPCVDGGACWIPLYPTSTR